MRDNLKEYINNNRESFDDLEPRDLWTNIDQALSHTSSDLTQDSKFDKTRSSAFKKIKTMFKYGFGASAIVIGTFFLITSQKENPASLVSTAKTEKQSLPEPKETPTSFEEKKEIKRTKSSVASAEMATSIEKEMTITKQDSLPEEISIPQKATVPYFVTRTSAPANSLAKSDLTKIDTLFKNVKRVVIKLDFCDVDIKRGEADQVKVYGNIEPNNGSFIVLGRKAIKKSEHFFKFDKKDEVLTVWMETKKVNERMHSSDISNKSSVLNFEVPVNTAIEVNNTSGNVTVSGIESQNMSLQTSFGNLKAENITSNLIASSSSGNVCLININGPVKSTTSFGKQLLQNIHGDVTVTANSGDVTLREIKGNAEVSSTFGKQTFAGITGNIRSNASSGDLSFVNVIGNINTLTSFGSQRYNIVIGNLNATASSGNININYINGSIKLKTTFGNIKGRAIRLVKSGDVNTSSGDIHLNFLNEMKDLSFDLISNSGKLLVEKNSSKNSGENKLMVGEGNVLVKGVSSFGNQTYSFLTPKIIDRKQ